MPSLDIGRALKSVNLVQSSLDCRANVEQFNHQCFERSAKICKPPKLQMEFNKEVPSASSGLVYVCFGSFVKCSRV
jgi:hypothetical protein